jgi:FAD/FMN-containing dehydrogenase
MRNKEQLEKIVGKENVSDAVDVLAKYSHDYSLVPPGTADLVVCPKTSEEVAEIVKWANENDVPVVPVSSQVHFYGCSIPKQGGLVVDLSRMNEIFEIDDYNRRVRIQPGVTWKQLTSALAEKGMRMIMPLCPPADRSVLTDFLEREVPTNTVYDYGEPTQSFELVWPTGDLFRLGSASVNGYPDSASKGANPSGPGLDFYRFLQGAQGTFGIVTWMNLKAEFATKIDKILCAPVDDLALAQDFLYRVLPRRIGQEVVLLNNVDLAAILADDFGADFDRLRVSLPAWSLIMVISGVRRRPEEKVAYEMKFLDQVMKAEFQKIKLVDTLPGFPGAGRKLLKLLREPWPEDKPYWKTAWRGGAQSLIFIARPVQTPLFVDIVSEVAARYGYPIADIGMYIQPIEHNRAAHVEFSFFHDPDDAAEKAVIGALYREAAQALMAEGAFFSRPYGVLSDMVYDKAASYTMALKRTKKVFDPKNVMNPGNLCF